MATSRECLLFILEQLSQLEDITYCAMMGEYVLYHGGKVFGGIYDDRFLVKPVPAAVCRMPDAPQEQPYDGAKELLLVEQVDNPAFLKERITAMYPELPEPKKKRK